MTEIRKLKVQWWAWLLGWSAIAILYALSSQYHWILELLAGGCLWISAYFFSRRMGEIQRLISAQLLILKMLDDPRARQWISNMARGFLEIRSPRIHDERKEGMHDA